MWPDILTPALTYRMILLNAGQKPMSLKHQLEVVSIARCKDLERHFGDRIRIYREKDVERRSKNGQYQFSLLASAFQAFLQKNPNVDIRNEVLAELNQLDVLESYGNSVDGSEATTPDARFIEYVDFLLHLDEEAWRVYPKSRHLSTSVTIPSAQTLLSRETFHLGLAAAYAWSLERKPNDLKAGIDNLWRQFRNAEPGQSDPLALESLEAIQTGFQRRDNVGEQTRKLVFGGFREFFTSAGEQGFAQCWRMAL